MPSSQIRTPLVKKGESRLEKSKVMSEECTTRSEIINFISKLTTKMCKKIRVSVEIVESD